MATESQSLLDSPRGKRLLAVLCAVAFLDFVDASITNVALPHIREALGFSVQTLQWVPSAYLLTFGGLMLLGGRLADLFGRKRMLLIGIAIVGTGSLVGGLADSSGMFVAARLGQGAGAALMLPAALSTLTTTFAAGGERSASRPAFSAAAHAAWPVPRAGGAGHESLRRLSQRARTRANALLYFHAPAHRTFLPHEHSLAL